MDCFKCKARPAGYCPACLTKMIEAMKPSRTSAEDSAVRNGKAVGSNPTDSTIDKGLPRSPQ